MLAVGIGAEDVSQYLPQSADGVVVACENSPSSVTLSGHVEAVHNIKKRLDSQGIFARELKTGKAYHSPHMESVSVVYNGLLSKATRHLSSHDLEWRRTPACMISSVTGEEISSTHLDPSYWSDNLRNRVRFNTAVAALDTMDGLDTRICFIEIGPHSALAGPFKQICTAEKFDQCDYVPSLVRNHDDTAQLLSTAGSLFLKGFPVDLEAINSVELSDLATPSLKRRTPSLLVDLPPYQWNYDKTYWTEPRPSKEQRNLKHPRHDLLGSKISGMCFSPVNNLHSFPLSSIFPSQWTAKQHPYLQGDSATDNILGLSNNISVWRNVLRHQDVPWLRDHSVSSILIASRP